MSTSLSFGIFACMAAVGVPRFKHTSGSFKEVTDSSDYEMMLLLTYV